ncbi:MAG: hypothetical protein FWB74_07440 [Defluviitaleaceae bacterium]|nr:hypothetical protein [Defluviitaleaceae bacterium]
MAQRPRQNAINSRVRRDYRKIANPYISMESTAREFYPEEIPAPKPIPRVPRFKRILSRRKKELVDDIQENIGHHFLSVLVVIAFFGAVAGGVALSAMGRQAVMERESASLHLANLQASSTARLGEIQAGINIDAIEYYAINYLGMVRPELFQEVRLTTPTPAHISTVYEPSPSRFSFGRLWDSLFNATARN